MENENKNEYILTIVGLIANIINLIYNIPMIVLPWKNRSVTNISIIYSLLRITSTILWLAYSIVLFDIWYIILNIVSLISSGLLILFDFFQRKSLCGFGKKITNATNVAISNPDP